MEIKESIKKQLNKNNLRKEIYKVLTKRTLLKKEVLSKITDEIVILICNKYLVNINYDIDLPANWEDYEVYLKNHGFLDYTTWNKHYG